MPDKKPLIFDIDADIRNQDWLKNPSEVAIMDEIIRKRAAAKKALDEARNNADHKLPEDEKGKAI